MRPRFINKGSNRHPAFTFPGKSQIVVINILQLDHIQRTPEWQVLPLEKKQTMMHNYLDEHKTAGLDIIPYFCPSARAAVNLQLPEKPSPAIFIPTAPLCPVLSFCTHLKIAKRRLLYQVQGKLSKKLPKRLK